MDEIRPVFRPYVSLYAGNKRHYQAEGTSAADFYAQLLNQPSEAFAKYTQEHPGLVPTMASESMWHACNQPYYKLYPSLVSQLQHVSLNIPVKHFHTPHDVFVVLISERHPVEKEGVNGLLVTHYGAEAWAKALKEQARLDDDRITDADADKIASCCGVFSITYQFLPPGADGLLDYQYGSCSIYFNSEEETLEDVLSREMAIWEEYDTATGASKYKLVKPDDGIPFIPAGQAEILVRLCMAAALFGTSQHKLLLPDLSKKHLVKFRKAVEQGDKEREARLRKKTHGWTIGRDVVLPNWAKSASSGDSDGEGPGLTHAHIRRGHVKMQPYGPDNSLRKLIFVAPTWVRPDLPVGPSRGYAIKE